MAFPTAAGYGNLPNGNFSPVIYSKQVQLAFRKASTVEAITNSDYFGEIANFGDSVKVIKEPEIWMTRILPLSLIKLTTLHSRSMTSKLLTAM